jgi:hypothetical protein
MIRARRRRFVEYEEPVESSDTVGVPTKLMLLEHIQACDSICRVTDLGWPDDRVGQWLVELEAEGKIEIKAPGVARAVR